MLAEFLGRLPVVVELRELGTTELERILVEPDDSVLREYQELLALDEVEVEFDEGALAAVAEHAIRRNVGARGLRAIVEEVLHDVMYRSPEIRGETVSFTRELVEKHLAELPDLGVAGD